MEKCSRCRMRMKTWESGCRFWKNIQARTLSAISPNLSRKRRSWKIELNIWNKRAWTGHNSRPLGRNFIRTRAGITRETRLHSILSLMMTTSLSDVLLAQQKIITKYYQTCQSLMLGQCQRQIYRSLYLSNRMQRHS